jgi:pimeloyl-ACP methyl ester carboxylesterase
MAERFIEANGVRLAVENDGDPDGVPVVLLHGLTATRRYVVMGSNHLARTGHRVISYDARGHGESSPAPDRDYLYADLRGDLVAVLDDADVERAVLAGASMGAHTALRFALEDPGRAAALVVITPAFVPGDQRDLDRWDALARGLREGGVEGFVAAYGEPAAPAWRETMLTVLRQRLSQHEHPDAVADALEVVPRSQPFAAIDDLRAIDVPAAVVASRDEADPGHPLAIAEEYAGRLPRSWLVVEEEGASPLAWQGSQLSRAIEEFLSSPP